MLSFLLVDKLFSILRACLERPMALVFESGVRARPEAFDLVKLTTLAVGELLPDSDFSSCMKWIKPSASLWRNAPLGLRSPLPIVLLASRNSFEPVCMTIDCVAANLLRYETSILFFFFFLRSLNLSNPMFPRLIIGTGGGLSLILAR